MGNSNSSTGTAFLAPVEQIEQRWEAYSSAGWRSMRVRELDELGGPGRAAVQSGGSFSEKMKLLEENLVDQRSQMQEMLSVSPTRPKDAQKGSGTRKFMMHTDKRAAERAGELAEIGTVMIGQKELAAAERLSGGPNHRAGGLQAHHSAPNQTTPGSTVHALQQQGRQLAATHSRGRGAQMADWRKRVHEARRRTMIVIIAMLRLRKGHKHHPQRPFRLDDLSFYIPDHLGPEKERFIKEFQKYLAIQEQIKTLEAALAELGGELGAAADRPLLHQFSQSHAGADAGVLAQLSLPGMPCPESPGHSSRLYRSMLSQRQHAPQPPPVPPPSHGSTSPSGDGLDFGGTRASPGRSIMRSSTETGRNAGAGGGIIAAAGSAMHSILEDPSYPMREHELSRRPRPLSVNGATPAAPNSPGQSSGATRPTSTTRPERPDSASGGSPNSNGGAAGSPGPSRRRLRPASVSGDRYDPAFAEVAVSARRPTSGRSLGGGGNPLISTSSSARATASPGRAGWNSFLRRGSDSGPSPPSSRTASVDRPRRLLKSESMNVSRHSPAPASGATIARVSRLHLQEQLKRETEALAASASLLQMYINRCNSAWADARSWSPAPVIGAGEEAMWLRNDQHEMYQADTLRKIRNGKIAVQLLAGDDKLVTSSGREYPLWSTDPWTLVEACRPGMMPQGERIKGVPLGTRLMCQLVTQVSQMVGGTALDKLYVVLHLNEEQEADVAAEMWSRGFYGLKRENVIFLVQEQHPGFIYDSVQRLFVKVESEGEGVARQQPNSGVALSQLAWPSEAFILNDAGVKQPLPLPALDYLHKAGVEWVVTKRLRDMALYSSKEGLLDINGLTHRLHMQDRSRASMVVDVMLAESAAAARQYGTVVFQCAQPPPQPGRPDSPIVNGPFASTSRSSLHTTELSSLELSSPQLLELLEASLAEGKLAVGLGRYLYHLPTMKKLLGCSTLWRPKLQLSEGHTLQVRLDMCDVTAPSTMHCIPVEAKRNVQLLTASTVDALIPLTQAQDADAAFKQIVTERVAARNTSATSATSAVATPSVELVGGDAGQGLSIVVFVTNNSVATRAVQTALYLARPGRDTVHLVTVVSTPTQRAEGQAFLDDYARQALQLMLDVRADVLVRGSTGLLDCMEAYLEQRCCADSTLVVLGSVQLTLSVFDSVVGSVAIAMLRRMIGLPLVVVTQNSKLAPAPFAGSGSGSRRNSGTGGSSATAGGVLKVMVAVEPHSRPLCHMICGQLLAVRSRGDKLVLAQVLPNQMTSQQSMTQRRLMESFHTVTISHRCPADKMLTYNCTPGQSVDEPLLVAVEEQGVGLLAMQVAAGSKTLPKHLMKLLRSCKGAVLVYQESVAGDGALFRRMKASDPARC